jgi:2-polyprenyl-6-methoxyphenol hydroxylase-like FAD-dependent oxidoreductase
MPPPRRELRCGTEATAIALLRDDDSGRVSGVRVQDRSGRIADLRAAITVGADGVRSTGAEQAGAALVRQGGSRSALLYRHYADARATGYEWAYGAGAAGGFIPTNDGLTGVFVSTTPAQLRTLRRDGTEHAFATLLAGSAPRLAERVASAEPASRIHGWAGVQGFVRRAWVGFGRGRRLLEGPAHHPRYDRRAP